MVEAGLDCSDGGCCWLESDVGGCVRRASRRVLEEHLQLRPNPLTSLTVCMFHSLVNATTEIASVTD